MTRGDVVLFQRDGRVARIILNRPEARNAIDAEVARRIEDSITAVEEDPDVWVAVLGAVGPAFSAGADLKQIAAGKTAGIMTERGGFGGLARRARTKPLIAAVDGAAVGGGCELALACDLIVASTAASFGLPEVKRALIATGGGLFRLPSALPRNVALELIMTGRSLPAERAYELGMVNRLAEPGRAIEAALELATEISANGPLAVRASREVVVRSYGDSESTGWALTEELAHGVRASEDAKEGPRAFVEKRAPRWSGR